MKACRSPADPRGMSAAGQVPLPAEAHQLPQDHLAAILAVVCQSLWLQAAENRLGHGGARRRSRLRRPGP